eukprot:TRINITY_DN21747_c0_g1_i1.p1 TRINITY_DN21747_c0_g1~~TRINITY_DN21747_c0_g1_i1.p1  ORF type:complete len:435 (+),score=89.66 TRINITY_DN21747_c0_g1_i1:86-1390(+)
MSGGSALSQLSWAPPVCHIDVTLERRDWLPDFEIVTRGSSQATRAVYPDITPVGGTVVISPQKSAAVDHTGVRVELIGLLTVRSAGRGFLSRPRRLHFLTLAQPLLAEGRISSPETHSFRFPKVEAPYDSYVGSAVHVSYCVRVTVLRRRAPDVVGEAPLWVRRQTPCTDTIDPALCPSLHAIRHGARATSLWARAYTTHANPAALGAEPGSEGRRPAALDSPPRFRRRGASAPPSQSRSAPAILAASEADPGFAPRKSTGSLTRRGLAQRRLAEHPMTLLLATGGVGPEVVFRFERNIYHTSDIIRGVLVASFSRGVAVSSVELSVVRREFLAAAGDGDGDGACLGSDTLFTGEVVDGDPQEDAQLPFSLPLRGITTLSPTYVGLHGEASVRYYIAAKVYTANGRAFTKDQEVVLWRMPDPPPPKGDFSPRRL